VFGPILPTGVHPFDQHDLLLTSPAFQLFFTADCCASMAEGFVVHETVNLILLRETLNRVHLVLHDAAIEKASDTGVESTGAAYQDVNLEPVVGAVAHGRMLPPAAWGERLAAAWSQPTRSGSFDSRSLRASLAVAQDDKA
jgi:hypothetical protein